MEACSVWFPLPELSISTEQWVSFRIFYWALNSHFKRALDFHLGISVVKWYTLKIAWTSTSKCLHFCSCVCASQPLVRQDQAEQAVECRPSLDHPVKATGSRSAPTGAANLQGTLCSQVTSCSLCDCRLLLF